MLEYGLVISNRVGALSAKGCQHSIRASDDLYLALWGPHSITDNGLCSVANGSIARLCLSTGHTQARVCAPWDQFATLEKQLGRSLEQ